MNQDEALETRLARLWLTTPPALDRRILAAAGAAMNERVAEEAGPAGQPVIATASGGRSRSRLLRPRWIGATAAAVCIAAALTGWWISRPPGGPVESAYGQLLQAAAESRAAEWVYTKSAQDGVMTESWMSFQPQQTFVRSSNGVIRYWDATARCMWIYDKPSNTLTIAPSDSVPAPENMSFMDVMMDRLKEAKGGQVAKGKEEVGGKIYTTYSYTELTGQAWAFRVDPAANRVVNLSVAGKSIDLEYPKTGPADIYALGVPKDAKVVDLRPTPGVVSVDEAVEKARRAFAPTYFAIICEAKVLPPDGRYDPISIKVVYKKNDRFRIEYYSPPAIGPKTPIHDMKTVEQWVGGISPSNILFCGTTDAKGIHRPVVSVRPDLAGARGAPDVPRLVMDKGMGDEQDTVEWASWGAPGLKPQKGAVVIKDPESTAGGLIVRQTESQGETFQGKVGKYPRRLRWSFDPNHDFLFSRYESLEDAQGDWQQDKGWLKGLGPKAADPKFHVLFTIKILDFAQTAQGQWYAAKVLRESEGSVRSFTEGGKAGQTNAGGASKDAIPTGKQAWVDLIYLDTARKLDDNLFDPDRLDAKIFVRGRAPSDAGGSQ
jgi:hypothetical protein